MPRELNQMNLCKPAVELFSFNPNIYCYVHHEGPTHALQGIFNVCASCKVCISMNVVVVVVAVRYPCCN